MRLDPPPKRIPDTTSDHRGAIRRIIPKNLHDGLANKRNGIMNARPVHGEDCLKDH